MTKARDLARVGSNAEYGLNFRNRIINGDMRIDQRRAGAAVTNANGYIVDRMISNYFGGGTGRWTAQQVVDSPAGFINSLKITVTTTDAAPSAGYAYSFVGQLIEGFNVADLGWGTASAKTITISFWVKSSLTGSFPVVVHNNSANRGYGSLYTINSANTWEQKSITIVGDTTGTWETGNGNGLALRFGAGGSSRTISSGSWTATGGTTPTNVTGAVNLLGTNAATLFLTGVQLEVGSSATPFETRPYGTELALCQRYFWSSFAAVGATPSGWGANFVQSSGIQGTTTTGMIEASFICQVPMRAAPTGSVWDHVGTAGKTSSFNPNAANYSGESGYVNSTSPYIFKLQRISGNASSAIGAYVQLSAEL